MHITLPQCVTWLLVRSPVLNQKRLVLELQKTSPRDP
jgi:hypothetical protein